MAGRIAAGLELALSQLLRLDEGGTVAVVRRGERRQGPDGAEGHPYELLTPPLPGLRAEVSRHELAPGSRTGAAGDPPMHEPGSRETAVVEAGSVVLVCDGERHSLDAGDCVTFDADLPHHFENPGPDAGDPAGRRERRPAKELIRLPTTLFDKIWEAHEVAPGLLYVDLHLVHEVTSPQAFEGLRLAGRAVRRPDRTLATADHNVPTDGTPVAARIQTRSRARRSRRWSATARSSASPSTRWARTARASSTSSGPSWASPSRA